VVADDRMHMLLEGKDMSYVTMGAVSRERRGKEDADVAPRKSRRTGTNDGKRGAKLHIEGSP